MWDATKEWTHGGTRLQAMHAHQRSPASSYLVDITAELCFICIKRKKTSS